MDIKETIAKMLCEQENVYYDNLDDYCKRIDGTKNKRYYLDRAESVLAEIRKEYVPRDEVMSIVDKLDARNTKCDEHKHYMSSFCDKCSRLLGYADFAILMRQALRGELVFIDKAALSKGEEVK